MQNPTYFSIIIMCLIWQEYAYFVLALPLINHQLKLLGLNPPLIRAVIRDLLLPEATNLTIFLRTSLNSATCLWENMEKTLDPVLLALRDPRDDCLSELPVLAGAGAGAGAGASSAAAAGASSSFAFFFLIFLSLSAWRTKGRTV